MNIKIDNKTYKLEYTFNSFKYIEDFDLSSLNEIENKPFKIIRVLSDLFYGAINCKVDNEFTREKSDELLEKHLEKTTAIEFLEVLFGLLENSNFFKNLQNKTIPQ